MSRQNIYLRFDEENNRFVEVDPPKTGGSATRRSRKAAPRAGKAVTSGVMYKPVKTRGGDYVYRYKGSLYQYVRPRKSRPPKHTAAKLDSLIATGKIYEVPDADFMEPAPNKRYDAPVNEKFWEGGEKKRARLAARSEAMKGQRVPRGVYGQPRKSKYYKLNGVSYVWVGEGPPISLPTKADKIMAERNGQIAPTKAKSIKMPYY